MVIITQDKDKTGFWTPIKLNNVTSNETANYAAVCASISMLLSAIYPKGNEHQPSEIWTFITITPDTILSDICLIFLMTSNSLIWQKLSQHFSLCFWPLVYRAFSITYKSLLDSKWCHPSSDLLRSCWRNKPQVELLDLTTFKHKIVKQI